MQCGAAGADWGARGSTQCGATGADWGARGPRLCVAASRGGALQRGPGTGSQELTGAGKEGFTS